MFDFSFVFKPTQPLHSHTDIEFFYVLAGTAVFTLEEKEYRLNKDDFLVVNVDKNHAYYTEGDFLGASIHISYSKLCSMMKQSVVFFWCNTTTGHPEGYDELRRIFGKIVSAEYNERESSAIYRNSLFYEFLHVLTTDYLLSRENEHYSQEVHEFDARKHEIMEFIQKNFHKPITLNDLAQQMFLSYAYLSKYIKRNFGMGFAEYLNQVRLNYAVSQLLHSDMPIVRIAMESGFASSAALNKAFRQVYNMPPTEYRRQWVEKNGTTVTTQESKTDIRKRLERHFERNPVSRKDPAVQAPQTVTLQNAAKRRLKRNWCRMINIGTAADLLQSNIQQQLLILKQELKFEYVRFWDLHSSAMQLGDAKTGFNFSKLDQVIDFLLQNDMKPYIELRPKPKLIHRTPFDVIYSDVVELDEEVDRVRYFIRRLFIHLLNRYSSEQVESWYFEIWCSEAEQEMGLLPPEQKEELLRWYQDRFRAVACQIRELCPGAKLGGGGLSTRFGVEQIRSILESWRRSDQQPDFISLYYYPYTMYTMDKARNQSRAADLLQKTLQQIREDMNALGYADRELHVSEWNFSISNRNVLNDSCMKGAYVVRSILESIDLADVMGYWVGTDLFGTHSDAQFIVHGGCGLLSRDGIRKPAFYAFDFMNHLGRYVHKKGDNYIITDNGGGNWRIVCHNLKKLNHQYSLQNEGKIRISEQNNLFENLKKHTIHFSLPGKRGERYILKCLTVNQYSGSVQDEWVSMSSPEEMTMDEIQYLSRVVTPRMVVKRLAVESGKLSFDITMEPNEIAYIHLIYQYS